MRLTSCRPFSRPLGSRHPRPSTASHSDPLRERVSMPRSPIPRAPARHTTQYYEMFGCRALYHEGWKAVTYHPIMQTEPGIDADSWELYDMDRDPIGMPRPGRGRARAPAADDRPVVGSMRRNTKCSRWTHDRFPLWSGSEGSACPDRQRYVYYPDAAQVPELMAVNVKNRTHRVVARVNLAARGASGVLVSQGSGLGGWCIYVQAGRLHYVHNRAATATRSVVRGYLSGAGSARVDLRIRQVRRTPGPARLVADGAVVAEWTIKRFTAGTVLTDRGRHHLRLQQWPPGGRRDRSAPPGSRGRSKG